jgi:uncharacterized protein YdhG (YjbR/CyaY superfamily)
VILRPDIRLCAQLIVAMFLAGDETTALRGPAAIRWQGAAGQSSTAEQEGTAMERGFAASTVEEYLAAVPPEQGRAIDAVRQVILATVPGCTEHIGYGVPIFDYRKRGLVGLSVAEDYCSLHLMSPPLARELKAQITEGDLVGATLHFTPDEPLSEATVLLILERRMAEVDTHR